MNNLNNLGNTNPNGNIGSNQTPSKDDDKSLSSIETKTKEIKKRTFELESKQDLKPKVLRDDYSVRWAQDALIDTSYLFNQIISNQNTTKSGIEDNSVSHQLKIDELVPLYLTEIGKRDLNQLKIDELFPLFILTHSQDQKELHEKCYKVIKEILSKDCQRFVNNFLNGDKQLLKNDKLVSLFKELFSLYLDEEKNKILLARLFPVMREASENPEILFCLSFCYELGMGVEKNVAESIKLLEKSADAGCALAQLKLGKLYLEGDNVSKDLIKGISLIRQAVNAGLPEANVALGECYYNGVGVIMDRTHANLCYMKAILEGDPKVKSDLAIRLSFGIGVDKDPTKAFSLYKLAAEAGFTKARHNLGVCYLDGNGVNKDIKEALKCFMLSAEEGFSLSQNMLYRIYRDGVEGVKEDIKEATKWLEFAAKGGDSDAQYKLYLAYRDGQGVEIDFIKSILWLGKSAASGNKDAQYELSEYYRNSGNVALENYWLQEAIKNGHQQAKFKLDQLNKTSSINSTKQ